MIGSLAVNLSLQTAAFRDGINITQKRLQGMQDKFAKVGARMQSVGAKLTLGLTAPLAAFGVSSFNAAKDAVELDAAFGETFGGMTKTMHDWADATGNAMGRSTRELKEGMNTFGLYFNQVAKTREEAANMSQTFTVLAQDLASFHNTDVATAIQSLRSGLAGEAEPMRKFGVFLSETAVSAMAAKLGIAELGTKLSDEEKIAARYAIIMEKTADAHGDVMRTSDSAANQIRRSQAAWEELQIMVGTKIIPLLTPLVEGLGNVLTKFNELSPRTQSWAIGIGAAAAALGPLMFAVGAALGPIGKLVGFLAGSGAAAGAGGLAAKIAPLTRLLGPLGIAAGAAYIVWKNWDTIGPKLATWGTGFQQRLEALGPKIDALDEKAKTFMDGVDALDRKMGTPTKDEFFESIRSKAVASFNGIEAEFTQFNANIAIVDRAIASFARNAWTNFEQMWDRAKRAFQGITTAAREWLVNGLNAVWNGVKAKVNAIGDAFYDLKQRVVGNSDIPDMVMGIADWMGRLQGVMVDPALSATEKVGAAFQGLANIIGGLFGSKAGNILGAFGQLVGALSPIFHKKVPGVILDDMPGMHRGGSGTFGGLAGVDRNVLSLNGSPIAKVSKGEHFRVSPANGNSGRPYFDLRGAVMTHDLLRQMNEIGAVSTGQGAVMGASGGVAAMSHRASRRLP